MVAKASFRGRIYETIHQYERHWTVTFRYGASFMRHALVAALLATSMFSLPTTAHAQAMSAEEAAALRAELATLRAKVETLEARIDQASPPPARSEEHTSELQSLMRISYAVFCLKKKKKD